MNVLAWVVAAAAIVSEPDPGRPGPHESYEHVPLAEGVHAFLAPEGRTGTVQGNLLAVIGQEAVLVVDGLSLDDARTRVDLGRFRRLLAGDDFWRGQAFDQFFLRPAVEQAYKEAKGEPNVEPTDG